jgi:hypothetical protein
VKMDLYMIEEDDPGGGKRYGVQCSACPEKFFDRMSKGKHPRVLDSGVVRAIEHARTVHKSEGGKITVKPPGATVPNVRVTYGHGRKPEPVQ